MKKESTLAARALRNGTAYRGARTVVNKDRELFLHGNRIAWVEGGHLCLTLAGWGTVTTRDRLNHVCSVFGIRGRFSQIRHIQHFNGDEIDATDVIRIHPADMIS